IAIPTAVSHGGSDAPLRIRPAVTPSTRPFGRKLSATATANDDSGPNESTDRSQLGTPAVCDLERHRNEIAAPQIRTVPMTIFRTAASVSCTRRRASGSALAPSVLRNITSAIPITHPSRNGNADAFRLGENKIMVMTMIGTELTARATAIGSKGPTACHMVLTSSRSGGCRGLKVNATTS